MPFSSHMSIFGASAVQTRTEKKVVAILCSAEAAKLGLGGGRGGGRFGEEPLEGAGWLRWKCQSPAAVRLDPSLVPGAPDRGRRWLHAIKTSCLHFGFPVEETKRDPEGVTSALIPCELGPGFNAAASNLFYF